MNSNPNNALNFNVSTQKDCEDCHTNNAITRGINKYSTSSHYASLELPESINCIFCHLNEDNSENWGSAALINKNRTSLVELDRIRNKFTLKAGQSLDLGSGFKIKLLEVSTDRNALIEFFKNEISIDKSIVSSGNYTYEDTLILNSAHFK